MRIATQAFTEVGHSVSHWVTSHFNMRMGQHNYKFPLSAFGCAFATGGFQTLFFSIDTSVIKGKWYCKRTRNDFRSRQISFCSLWLNKERRQNVSSSFRVNVDVRYSKSSSKDNKIYFTHKLMKENNPINACSLQTIF